MEEHKIKISIIVPVYNVESCLGNCLDSLLTQDLSQDEYEIILIDDESKDNSLAICKEYANKYSFIHVYTQKNAGASVARTKGIDVAKGEYLFFVDSDDYIAPFVLKKMYEKASNSKCDILFFNTTTISGNGGESKNKTYKNLKRDVLYSGEFLSTHIDNNFGSLWGGIYRREFIIENKLEFTKGIIHQDADFNIRTFPFAKNIMIIDEYVYYYRYIGESATRTNNLKKLQLMQFSDFVIVKNIKDYLQANNFSKELTNHYKAFGNSLLISSITQIYKKRKVYGHEFVYKCLDYSYNNGLFPIKGKTCSWKSTIIVPLVNLSVGIYMLLNKR